ncbi:MAG: ISL3 family transposase [Candidatus Hydrogenedentes bacterium]|nr:ISL3 family transposase [Candidatus Hydrogenedentota bacterium]
MRDHELYARILEIRPPWQVSDVKLQVDEGEIQVFVVADPNAYCCPKCSKKCPGYDSRERRWRHLDTCQYRTILVADIPRVNCPEHGVTQIAVPWAEPGSRFTALYEAMVIDWLQEASFQAVARQLRLSWDEVAGIQARAVARGLARRKFEPPKRIGVDETSFQKRHEDVTVVCDLDRKIVLHVADDHYDGSLDEFYEAVGPEGVSRLEVVSMDMWRAYIGATRRHVPDADQKICFDKYHVAGQLGKAVDLVRKSEHRALQADGNDRLKRTKFWWLTNPKNMSHQLARKFAPLKRSALKTARAWAIKELAMGLWHYRSRSWAEKAWKSWLNWALRCRLKPMLKAAATVRKYLWGILNAIVHNANNALAEGMNSRIQVIKRRACGYRNRERFRNAIYFHLGGLELYPSGVITHPKS